MCVLVIAPLLQRRKINLSCFEKNSITLSWLPLPGRSKKFQNTLILAIEANSALSQNYPFFRILAHCELVDAGPTHLVGLT